MAKAGSGGLPLRRTMRYLCLPVRRVNGDLLGPAAIDPCNQRRHGNRLPAESIGVQKWLRFSAQSAHSRARSAGEAGWSATNVTASR